jgi:hypothetical protein
MLKGNNKMRKMNFNAKYLLIGIFGFFSFLNLSGQANPGYLGRKSLVQIDISGLMGNAIFEGPLMNLNFGASYEFSKSKDFAWNIGYKKITQQMNPNMVEIEKYSLYETDNNGNSEYNGVKSGYFTYSINEIKITPKFYKDEKGAIGPYGSYSGLEIAYDQLSISDVSKIGWIRQPASLNSIGNVTIIAVSYVQGGRRMLTDQIGLDYNFGMGYTIYQSTPNSLIELVDGGGTTSDVKDYLQTVAMKHASSSKLFQASIGISYLF